MTPQRKQLILGVIVLAFAVGHGVWGVWSWLEAREQSAAISKLFHEASEHAGTPRGKELLDEFVALWQNDRGPFPRSGSQWYHLVGNLGFTVAILAWAAIFFLVSRQTARFERLAAADDSPAGCESEGLGRGPAASGDIDE